MVRAANRSSRRAATVVECSLVLPLTFFLLLTLLVGSMGVFRYQEVATLAREASRYASTWRPSSPRTKRKSWS